MVCLSKQPALLAGQMSMSILLVAKRCQAFTLNLAAATCSEFSQKKHRKEAAALSEKFTKIKMEKGLRQMDTEC